MPIPNLKYTHIALIFCTFGLPTAVAQVQFDAYSSPVPGQCFRGVHGDMNSDGMADLISSTNMGNYHHIALLLSSGFEAYSPVALQQAPGAAASIVAVGDVNGDGRLDLITPNGNVGGIDVFLGDGFGGIGSPTLVLGAGQQITQMRVEDYTNDGLPDLSCSNNKAGTITILAGSGQGAFLTSNVISLAGAKPDYYETADLNGDNRLDFVTINEFSELTIVVSSSNGGFALPTTLSNINLEWATIGDLDVDGHVDIAVMSDNEKLITYKGNGLGSFSQVNVATPTVVGHKIGCGDINEDGRCDVISDGLSILENKGNLIFVSTSLSFPSPVPGFQIPMMVDLNGDGMMDFQLGGCPSSSPDSQFVWFVNRNWHIGGIPFGSGMKSCDGRLSIGIGSAPRLGAALQISCTNVSKYSLSH